MALGNEYSDSYGTCNETYASLIISRGADPPQVVTEQLCLQPTTMRELGQAGRWRNGEWLGQASELISRFHIWKLETKGIVESRDSLRHIDYLLEILDGKEDVLVSLARDGWKIEICVFWDSKWGHGGPIITPITMSRLAQLGIALWYDVYFTEPNRAPEEVEDHPNWFRIGL